MENMEDDLGRPSEKLRKMLIEQELKMRKKQPEHWAKTKYRKYAKPFTELELEQIKELEKKRTNRRKKKKDAGKKAKAKAMAQAASKPKRKAKNNADVEK